MKRIIPVHSLLFEVNSSGELHGAWFEDFAEFIKGVGQEGEAVLKGYPAPLPMFYLERSDAGALNYHSTFYVANIFKVLQ